MATSRADGYNKTFVASGTAVPAVVNVKAGPGIVHSLLIASPVATGTVVLYDSLTNTSAFFQYTAPASPTPVCMLLDINFNVGLTYAAVTAGQDFTITWK